MNQAEKRYRLYESTMSIGGKESARRFWEGHKGESSQWSTSPQRHDVTIVHEEEMARMKQAPWSLLWIAGFFLFQVGLTIWYLVTGERLPALPIGVLYVGMPLALTVGVMFYRENSPEKRQRDDSKFKQINKTLTDLYG